MNLLVLTNDKDEAAGFEDYVEDVERHSLADIGIETGETADVEVEGTPLEEYDSVYLDPEPKAAIYARVLLETIQEHRIPCNLNPTAFFIMAKKHYLFKVLTEKDIAIPSTVAISTAKGLNNIEETIDFPALVTTYEGFKEAERSLVNSTDEISSMVEYSEHGTHVTLVQEMEEEDIYDALYLNGEVIALKLDRDNWPDGSASNPQYHNLSTEQQEILEDTAQSIGTKICRVKLVGTTVLDVENRPELNYFEEKSGKNVYGRVSEVLRGDND
ncbi:MAG: hypothetical protein SV186_04680 [Candidatus Nanohaloarchaea archaeon]|nr:hypothetical protein [Candidatus Nanohaloarchaea archaeon]